LYKYQLFAVILPESDLRARKLLSLAGQKYHRDRYAQELKGREIERERGREGKRERERERERERKR
jgi:hypothetical protein